MTYDTQTAAKLQKVLDDLRTMTAQIIQEHPRKAHIAADMQALVDEWAPVARAEGFGLAAAVMGSYAPYWLVLVPEPVS